MYELGAEVLVGAEDGAEHCADVVAAESLEWEVGDDAGALEIRDEFGEAGPSLLAAIGEGDDDGLGGVAPREVKDQLECRVVAPVHVFESDEHRLLAGELRDRLRENVKQTSAVGLRVDAGAWRDIGKQWPKLGKHRDEIARRRLEDMADDGPRRRAGERSEERRVGKEGGGRGARDRQKRKRECGCRQ